MSAKVIGLKERKAVDASEFRQGPEGFAGEVIDDAMVDDLINNGHGIDDPLASVKIAARPARPRMRSAQSIKRQLESKWNDNKQGIINNWPALAIIGLAVVSELRSNPPRRRR